MLIRAPARHYMVKEFHVVLRHMRNFVFPLHANLRSKKLDLFFQTFAPHPTDSLLDVGGCPGAEYTSLHSFFAHVALLNIRPVDHPKGILGDACKMSLPDKSFDWVFSNALIEHVGNFSKQFEMAEEVRRVARKGYFIATPNRHFPIDPHTYIPFFHLMPETTIDRVAVGAYWMLSPTDMKALFPSATVMTTGFGTSVVAMETFPTPVAAPVT
jgi:hypothetical protein